MNRQSIILFCLFCLCFRLNAQDLTSTNLPILIINTNGKAIVNEPKVDAELGIIWNNDKAPNSIHSPFNHFQGKIGIELRGSSSMNFDKKGYAMATRKEDGSNLNVSLLGFPAENDWVLHGPYSDKSLMRNALAYTMAGWIMEYAPRVRFVEVMLNGSYAGVYLFTEKIKRDKNRVAIAELLPDENTGDDLTGGYILKIDKWDGANNAGFNSSFKPYPGSKSTTTFQFHYPKPRDITTEQKDYIQTHMYNLESALHSTSFNNPVYGYRKYFDIPSFMQNMFIQEMSKNVDAYRLSQFMYKDKESVNGKLKMGPVWDFNLGFGNANYCAGQFTYGWAYEFNNVCPSGSWEVHFWWPRMMEDESFRAEISAYWKLLRKSTLTNTRIFGLIDSLQQVLEVPAVRNFNKWKVLGKWVWPNAYVGSTYEQELSYLRNWLTARLAWMDASFDKMTPANDTEKVANQAVVFPNPVSQELTFEFYTPVNKNLLIELYDALGRKVLTHKEENSGSGVVQKNLSLNEAAGMYYYKILLDNEAVYSGKLIKK